jgi:hypothetical protein
VSNETRMFVRIPDSQARQVLDLATQSINALARSAKLLPGDRTEAIRFEALHTSIDLIAVSALGANAPFEMMSIDGDSSSAIGPTVMGPGFPPTVSTTAVVEHWLRETAVVVELRLPHGLGNTVMPGAPGTGSPKPATRWTSSYRRAADAIRERFRHLLTMATEENHRNSVNAALCPSGIPNRILTESLREFTAAAAGTSRTDVPVLYRDQSKGRPFPLRALNLVDSVPNEWRTLRFTLMSIRHVEMDAIVDGAWLRNAKISRPRPAAQTDELVYSLSLRQLELLSSQEQTVILMYQTGLETAIVGFYRAVIEHLLRHPHSICVVPHYFQATGEFTRGCAWTTL